VLVLQAAGALLTINPLVSASTRYFAIDSLRYRGHDLAVAFDRDGNEKPDPFSVNCFRNGKLIILPRQARDKRTQEKLHQNEHAV
jgi:hypothetical protein